MKNKTTFVKEQKMTSKVEKMKKSSNITIDIAKEKVTKTKIVKCDVSKRTQKKRKQVINEKTQDQILDTLHCEKFEKICEEFVKEQEVDCIEDQQPLASPLATTRPIICGENLTKREYIGTSQRIENTKSTTNHNIAIPIEKNFEPVCEDCFNEFELVITMKRVLLLHNIDPKLHFAELQVLFVEIFCILQKYS
jgi:hypothetical protein